LAVQANIWPVGFKYRVDRDAHANADGATHYSMLRSVLVGVALLFPASRFLDDGSCGM